MTPSSAGQSPTGPHDDLLERLAVSLRVPHGAGRADMTATEPRQKSERRQRTHLVGVRLLPAEHATLNRAAVQRGVSVSTLLRTSALSALACGDEHPLSPGILCRVVGPHVLHDYDGLSDWAVEPEPTEENR